MNRNHQILGSDATPDGLMDGRTGASTRKTTAWTGVAAALLGAAALLSLSGCGLKGPLYLPAPAQAASQSSAATAPSAAPAK